MSERENMATGIYAALSALVVLVCLIGAFVLPPSIVNSKWLGIFALVGAFIVTPVLMRVAHRSRIRDAVEKLGGSVLGIRKLPFWDQACPRCSFFLGIRYRVDYVDFVGETHRAFCISGFFQGVEWLRDEVVDSLVR